MAIDRHLYADRLAATPLTSSLARQLDVGTEARLQSKVFADPLACWHDEGGAIVQSANQTPANAPLRLAARYFVGGEEYSDLRLAIEAHARQCFGEER